MTTATTKPKPKPKEETKLNIYGKLSQIQGELAAVQKMGENKFHNYKYVREAEALHALKPLLKKYNLCILPSFSEITEEIVTNKKGEAQTLTKLWGQYTIVNGDNPEESVTLRFPGCGVDALDKGIYKAMTGSTKYFTLKTFLVPTEEDPEADKRKSFEQDVAAANLKAEELKKSEGIKERTVYAMENNRAFKYRKPNTDEMNLEDKQKLWQLKKDFGIVFRGDYMYSAKMINDLAVYAEEIPPPPPTTDLQQSAADAIKTAKQDSDAKQINFTDDELPGEFS